MFYHRHTALKLILYRNWQAEQTNTLSHSAEHSTICEIHFSIWQIGPTIDCVPFIFCVCLFFGGGLSQSAVMSLSPRSW